MNKNNLGFRRLFLTVVTAFTAVSLVACTTGPKVEKGKGAKISYTGTLKDGRVFDTTEGKQPLAFTVGSGQILPAFESQLMGLRKGSKKKFTLKPDDAYGQHDPNKIVALPRDGRFKKDGLELKEGGVLFANQKLPDGQVVQTPLKIVKLTEEEVTIDSNHPLAGQDLTFQVEIVDVFNDQESATASAQQGAAANPEEAAAPQPAD